MKNVRLNVYFHQRNGIKPSMNPKTVSDSHFRSLKKGWSQQSSVFYITIIWESAFKDKTSTNMKTLREFSAEFTGGYDPKI